MSRSAGVVDLVRVHRLSHVTGLPDAGLKRGTSVGDPSTLHYPVVHFTLSTRLAQLL